PGPVEGCVVGSGEFAGPTAEPAHRGKQTAIRTRVDPYARRFAVHDGDPPVRGGRDRRDADDQVGRVALGLLERDGVDKLEEVLKGGRPRWVLRWHRFARREHG